MKSDDIKNTLNSLNPLMINGKDYLDAFSSRIDNATIQNETILEKLGNTQDINSDDFLSQYRQGIAEMFLWFWFSKNDTPFSIEQNKNNKNNSNVDVVFEKNGAYVNIEVKSPIIPSKVENNKLHPELSNRLNCGVDDLKRYLDVLLKEMGDNAPEAGFEGIDDLILPRDNKIKDTLLSCQNKFCQPTDSEINVLFIATSTKEMISYWNYICNEAGTGFFNEGSYVKHSEFDKVNAIILSNCISLNERYNGDSWDLDKAVNIVLTNEFSSNFAEFAKKWLTFSTFLPDNTLEYVKYMCNFKKDKEHKDSPELVIHLEYLRKKGFMN